jgi:uncharacterized protein (TIGR00375 family)
MKFFADLHIHSRYSRATSPQMDLENLAQWAKYKGIEVLGTGDFTHHLWFSELSRKLKESSNGLYEFQGTKFMLTGEISSIYTKNGKVRKVHSLIFAPSLESVDKFNRQLAHYGNLTADGRPILGLEAKNILEIALSVSPDFFLVPAHAWTPWFSVFGANSGFDSLEECFEELTPHVKAIETGLSSDPGMNWRLSKLDDIALISNSDAHSPSKIGREANLFDTTLDYPAIIKAISEKDPEKFLATIEFFPEEGKYHYDGHRDCGPALSPQDSLKNRNMCPKCRRNLTIGVMNRVEKLADRPVGFLPRKRIPFFSLVPLEEIIAEALGQRTGTKAVEEEYFRIIKQFNNEFHVLLDLPLEELASFTTAEIVEGLKRVREKKIAISPGYDGVYGKIKIFPERPENGTAVEEMALARSQMSLF